MRNFTNPIISRSQKQVKYMIKKLSYSLSYCNNKIEFFLFLS